MKNINHGKNRHLISISHVYKYVYVYVSDYMMEWNANLGNRPNKKLVYFWKLKWWRLEDHFPFIKVEINKQIVQN